jgi:hypothetical protein
MIHGWDDYSGITIDNYNYTFNLPNTVKRRERSRQEQVQVIRFQVRYLVLMEELYSRLAIVKYSSSPSCGTRLMPD